MKLPAKSAKNKIIEKGDYYSVEPKSIWNSFKQQRAAFWWLCIYLIFEYVRPQSLYPVIDILPWSQLALIFACVSALLDKDVKWVRSSGTLLFLMLIFVVVISGIFAFRPSVAFDKLEIILGWVVLYILIISVINTEQRFLLFLLVFFLVNFKMSQFGARNFLIGGYSKFGVSGAPGWFKDSGDLGIQMIIFVSLSTAFILALQQYWGLYKKLFFYLLPLTGLLTIIATTSRGAQLGMIAVGIWFLLISRKIKVLLGLCIIGALLYMILPPQMLEEFESAGEDSTSQTRLQHWAYGMEVVSENPILGIGYHNWVDYCRYRNPDGVGDTGKCLVAHNSYVTVSAETGVSGFIVYVGVMIFILVLNRRTRINSGQLDNRFITYCAYGLDGGVIGYMIATFFFSVTWYPMLYVQLAMTVSLFEISNREILESR